MLFSGAFSEPLSPGWGVFVLCLLGSDVEEIPNLTEKLRFGVKPSLIRNEWGCLSVALLQNN